MTTSSAHPDGARPAPRVVMVLPVYFPETFGGAEHQTRKFAQALARRGVAVTMLAPRLKGETPAWESEGPVVVRRFRLRAAPNLGGRHFDSFVWWCLCISSWLWRNRRGYDLIYVVHGRLHAFPAALAGRRLQKPVVVKPGRGGEASFDLSVVGRKRLLGSFFARSIARNPSAWVANSKEIAADLFRWGVSSERVHVIPNGVEIPDGEEQRSRNGVVQFVSMGRLEAEKAVDQTIRAFARLPADARAHLTILGDGPCRPALEALSRRLAQEGRIAFTGAVGDVKPYLNEADVYVSTSVSEGMSNALLEAMSSGVMPVVSQVSGADELVEEGVSGLLFPPGDETALAGRLELSLAMTAERRRATGEAAREAVRVRCALEDVVERHIALYRNLIEEAPCPRA